MMTGSRFPNPAYQINNRSVDLTRKTRSLTDPNSGKVLGGSRRSRRPDGPGLAVRRAAERLLDGLASRLLLAAAHRRDRRPRGAAAADLLPLQQLLRPAGAHRLERLQGLRPAAARLDRQLEPRPRLPERADQGLPGAGQRDGLVRPRPDPRPDRPLSQGPDSRPERHPRLLRLLRHLGPQGLRQRRAGLGPGRRHQRPARRGQAGLSAIATCRRSRTSAAGSTSATCSGSCPTTTSTASRTCGSSSSSPTSPTAISSRSITSG